MRQYLIKQNEAIVHDKHEEYTENNEDLREDLKAEMKLGNDKIKNLGRVVVILTKAGIMMTIISSDNIKSNLGVNGEAQAVNGNTNQLVIDTWNCRKGLLDKHGEKSSKMEEILQHLTHNKPQILTIIEADIHGEGSRTMRRNPANDETWIWNSTIRNTLRLDLIAGRNTSRQGYFHS